MAPTLLKFKIICLGFVTIILLGCQPEDLQKTFPVSDSDQIIHLQNRSIDPYQQKQQALSDTLSTLEAKEHLIVKFQRPLTLKDHQNISEKGMVLESYLGENTYLLMTAEGFLSSEDPEYELIQHVETLKPMDKLSNNLYNDRTFSELRDTSRNTNSYIVVFFSDTDENEVRSILSSIDGDFAPYGSPYQWRVWPGEKNIKDLANFKSVKFIEQGPLQFLPLNNGSKRATRSDEAQQAENGDDVGTPRPTYKKVSGNGIRIGICDSGVDGNHNDFFTITAAGNAGNSRVYSSRAGSRSHGTHVASIAAGNGLNSQANGFPAFHYRGHAPRAFIGDYPNFGDDTDRYYDAIVTDLTNVTNHSYVQTIEPDYNNAAANIDEIIRGDAVNSDDNDIPARPQVWAAGNNGTSAQYGNEEGYYAVFTSAKNSISVGSTDTELQRLSEFSSLGPTFDGRIKPDIMAPGCENSILADSDGIDAADNNTQGYTDKCGTSMAAPAVAGVVALLMEQHQQTFGGVNNLPPSYFKAILVHTAKDMIKTSRYPTNDFNNPDLQDPVVFHAGPDYATGYGLIDAEAARDKINHATHRRFGTIGGTGLQHNYCVNIPAGTDEFKATLAWDDEPGSSLSAATVNKLVNDLDIFLEAPDGTIHHPWTLDPLPLTTNPGDGSLDPITLSDVKPAYKAPDHRNNVEMVQVCNPAAGRWWIRVRGHNLPMGNSQLYSLISSHSFGFWCITNLCDFAPWICEFPVKQWPIQRIPDVGFEIDPRIPIPIDEICKYVLDCPGCEGSGWKLCPGYTINLSDVPQGVKVMAVNSQGEIAEEKVSDGNQFRIQITDINPHEQYYLIFSNSDNKALKEERLRIGIDLK